MRRPSTLQLVRGETVGSAVRGVDDDVPEEQVVTVTSLAHMGQLSAVSFDLERETAGEGKRAKQ